MAALISRVGRGLIRVRGMKHGLWKKLAVYVAVGILMAAGSGAYTAYLDRLYDRMERQTVEAGEDSAEQLAYAMAEHASATIRQIDFALRGLSWQFLDTPENFTHAVDAAVASFPALIDLQVTVVGTDGIVLYSSAADWEPVSVADREYFRELSQSGSDTLHISHPVIGRFTGKRYIQFAHRMQRDGTFAGIMVFSIAPDYISQILRGLALGPNDAAALVLMSDGTYLARNIGIDQLLGKRVKPSRPYLQPGSSRDGIFIDEATHEPIRRIYAWRKLPNLPLVVFVGLSERAVLQPVMDARFNSFVQNGILLGILVPSGFVLVFLLLRIRTTRRKLADSEALYRSLFEHNISVKLIVDPADGRIFEANPAACAFYGYSHEQLVGMNIAQINCLPGEEVRHQLDAAQSGRQGHFLFSHRLASGEIRQVEVYSGNVRIDGRDLLYSIIHDITEQKILARRLKESDTRYRMLFKAIPEGMIVVRSDRTIVGWNEAALEILQVNEAELKARQVALFRPTGERLSQDRYPSSRAITCDITSDLLVVETRSGERRWVFANSRRLPPMGEKGEISAVVVFSDVTHVVALEESALISKSVFEVSTEALLVSSPELRMIMINPAFYDLTGYAQEEISGRQVWDRDLALFPPHMEKAIAESLEIRRSWTGELTIRRKDGTTFTGALRIAAVFGPDDRLLRYVGLFSDVTDRKRQEKEMWRQANFDALTDLPNRTLLQDRIRQALAQVERTHLAIGVLFIDLDRFKPVNDTYGHAMGDQLLRDVARRLKDCVRTGDTVARVGGDEFIILLPMLENAQIPHNIAERILNALQRPFQIHDAVVEISASIGVACSVSGDQVDELVKRADDAMYQAKKSGRSKICMTADESVETGHQSATTH